MVVEVSQNKPDLERFTTLIDGLRSLIKLKIKYITQRHLMYSDKYYTTNASMTTKSELINAESNGYHLHRISNVLTRS